MSDYIVRAMAAGQAIRAFAIDGRELVGEAAKRHHTSHVMTAALGRTLMGGAMMGVMMKGEEDLLTLQLEGDGPGKSVTVTADSKGNVKGYVGNPDIELELNYMGKLDVGAAIGYGTLRVIKDIGLKEPYVGQVALTTSEVADDLTYYFAASEQTPSSVGLGVLVNPDGTVKQAAGFIVQLMPFASDEVIDRLEKNITSIPSVTAMMEGGYTPEQILEEVLKGFDIEITDAMPASFKCNCTKDRVSKALITIGKKNLKDMIDDNEPININCSFCNTNYGFDVEELKQLYEVSTAP